MASFSPRLVPMFLLGAACSAETTAPQPHAEVWIAPGFYDVPVTNPTLDTAATFAVDEVEWDLREGEIKLAYRLPVGLVGRAERVVFTGPATTAAQFQLEGTPGTALCTVTGTAVSCFEEMYGLQPVMPDLEVIADVAAREYPGPVQHRIDVARFFEADPLGIVRFDLASASPGNDDLDPLDD